MDVTLLQSRRRPSWHAMGEPLQIQPGADRRIPAGLHPLHRAQSGARPHGRRTGAVCAKK